MKIEELYKNLRKGDPLTNKELILLRDHFKVVADSCQALGDIFHLAFREANQRIYELNQFIINRGLEKQ